MEQGKSVRTVQLEKEEDIALVKSFQLLTSKPILYVCNVDEGSVVSGNQHVEAVKEAVKDEDAEVIMIGAGIEADIAGLDDAADREEFLNDLGLEEPGGQ